MGIYIKGMEMPKSCTECFLYRYDDRLRNEEERHICLRKCWTRLIRPTEERQGFCPLVEVKTPHGRLIDAEDMSVNRYDNNVHEVETIIEGEDE